MINSTVDRLSGKASKLQNVIQQLVIEFDTIRNTLENRLERSNIDSLLIAELSDKGIDSRPEYGILKYDNDSCWVEISPGFNKQSKDFFNIILFPNDLQEKTASLYVLFPDKQSQIYSSLFWLLITSAFFTLIILITFTFTIAIILRQKKVSEIKSDFINNMTHEFKTPIATISLAVDSIDNQKVINEPEKVKYFTDLIRKNKRNQRTRKG